MKKLFLTICFSIIGWQIIDASAKTVAFEDMEAAQAYKASQDNLPPPPPEDDSPDPRDTRAMEKYIMERLKKATISNLGPTDSMDKPSSVNMQHSDDYIAKMNEKNKSFFERIYDEAINRISSGDTRPRGDAQSSGTRYIELKQDDMQQFQAPDFPVVTVEFPGGERTLVPAQEHIPYFSTQIEILPNGTASINDTAVVVAAGKKLKNGLSRIIPKISTSREGVSNKIDLNLASVSINGQEVPHKIIEESDSYVIVPEEEYTLEPGVYTYNFQYLVDRQLWQYNDFNEFYWDATGSRWNLIIGKAMVSIRLPGSSKPLSSLVFLGYPDELTSAGTMMSEHKNVLGFAALVPLYIGEGMHVIVALPKTDFVPADRNRRLTWFLEDYGDILVATVGLLSILISYYLSWKHIAKNNLKNSNSFKRGAPLMRYLAMGVFDKISFAAFLLELYRKNIIDIQRGDKDILLVKRTDNLSSLERKERKAVNALFSRSEAVLALNAANQLKLKRAYKQVEANTLRKVKQLALKLNIGYLLFSIGMLLVAEAAMALLNINSGQAFAVLTACTVTIAFYLWVLKTKFKYRWLGFLGKVFAVIIIDFSVLVMSAYLHLVSAVMILAAVYVIFAYTSVFAKRSGLIKSNVKDAQQYREYLIRNAETIKLGRDFLNQQANILALDTAEFFEPAPAIKDYYKLDLMTEYFGKTGKKKGV